MVVSWAKHAPEQKVQEKTPQACVPGMDIKVDSDCSPPAEQARKALMWLGLVLRYTFRPFTFPPGCHGEGGWEKHFHFLLELMTMGRVLQRISGNPV